MMNQMRAGGPGSLPTGDVPQQDNPETVYNSSLALWTCSRCRSRERA